MWVPESSQGPTTASPDWEAGDIKWLFLIILSMLGSDHFERILIARQKPLQRGIPVQHRANGRNDIRITLAVAGFTMDDLGVSIEDNQLVIRGKQIDDSENRIFIHRGIAARQFQRSFVLAEGIDVVGATLDNGLLHVDLHREVPEPEIKTIEIKGAGAKAQTIDMESEKLDFLKRRAFPVIQ